MQTVLGALFDEFVAMEPRAIKVGDMAEVATLLRPGGFVVVHGERHSARCANGYLEVGTEVVVTGGDNHGFIVIAASESLQLELLPDFGKPVYSSFGASAKATALEAERQMQIWCVKRRKWRMRIGPAVGLVFAAVGVALVWDLLETIPTWENAKAWTVAGLLGIGAFVGLGLLGVIDAVLLRIDFALHRFSLGITALILAGMTAGLVWLTPQYGLLWGIVAAVVLGFLTGVPLAFGFALVARGDAPQVSKVK